MQCLRAVGDLNLLAIIAGEAMALGTKLSDLKERLYTKFGKQRGTLTFIKSANTPNASYGKAYSVASTTNVALTAGCKVSEVKDLKVQEGGLVKFGDLIIIVPFHLLTETQLTDARVTYLGSTYTVKKYFPSTVIDGNPVAWQIFAELQK